MRFIAKIESKSLAATISAWSECCKGAAKPPQTKADHTLTIQPTTLETIAAGREGARLRDCLTQLEEKNRSAIVLAFVHGLSHVQVAARLDLPLGTVKAWIRRGLLTLRACLGPSADTP